MKKLLNTNAVEVMEHLGTAGLGSLLRKQFFKRTPVLMNYLNINEEQCFLLMRSKLPIDQQLAEKLSKLFDIDPNVLHLHSTKLNVTK